MILSYVEEYNQYNKMLSGPFSLYTCVQGLSFCPLHFASFSPDCYDTIVAYRRVSCQLAVTVALGG